MPKRQVAHGNGTNSQRGRTDPASVAKNFPLLLCLTLDGAVADVRSESDHSVQRQPSRGAHGGERVGNTAWVGNGWDHWLGSQDV